MPMDCGCRIKNLPYTDADVAPASIVQCPLHASAEKLRDLLIEYATFVHEMHNERRPKKLAFEDCDVPRCVTTRAALNEAKGE